jgi:hypothetical protein
MDSRKIAGKVIKRNILVVVICSSQVVSCCLVEVGILSLSPIVVFATFVSQL